MLQIKSDCFLALYCCLFLLGGAWGVCAQTGSSCSGPGFYYLDTDGDGIGTQDYTQGELDQLRSDFSPNKGYSLSANVIYGCPDMFSSEVANSDDYVSNSGDCNDSNSDIHPGSVSYYDSDGDGDGNPNNSKVFNCTPDTGYVKKNGDCNDNNDQIHSATIWYLDEDGDGTGGSTSYTAVKFQIL